MNRNSKHQRIRTIHEKRNIKERKKYDMPQSILHAIYMHVTSDGVASIGSFHNYFCYIHTYILHTHAYINNGSTLRLLL